MSYAIYQHTKVHYYLIKGMCSHVTVVMVTYLLFQVGEPASLPVPHKKEKVKFLVSQTNASM